jgi:hypothetical protein
MTTAAAGCHTPQKCKDARHTSAADREPITYCWIRSCHCWAGGGMVTCSGQPGATAIPPAYSATLQWPHHAASSCLASLTCQHLPQPILLLLLLHLCSRLAAACAPGITTPPSRHCRTPVTAANTIVTSSCWAASSCCSAAMPLGLQAARNVVHTQEKRRRWLRRAQTIRSCGGLGEDLLYHELLRCQGCAQRQGAAGAGRQSTAACAAYAASAPLQLPAVLAAPSQQAASGSPMRLHAAGHETGDQGVKMVRGAGEKGGGRPCSEGQLLTRHTAAGNYTEPTASTRQDGIAQTDCLAPHPRPCARAMPSAPCLPLPLLRASPVPVV